MFITEAFAQTAPDAGASPFGSGLEETMKGLVKMVRGQRR